MQTLDENTRKTILGFQKNEITEQLGKKAITPDDLAEDVKKNPDLLPKIYKGISSPNTNIKFGCAKILKLVSAEKPETLYPKMDFFINLLDINNNIIKWNVMDVIGNLTKVDKDRRFDKSFQKYYDLLSDKSIVSAAHVIDNSGKIALAKPHLTQKITTELLKIENIPRSQECKNILMGKAILAFGKYFNQIDNKDEVVSFVKRQLDNNRNATKVKAEKFLKKMNR